MTADLCSDIQRGFSKFELLPNDIRLRISSSLSTPDLVALARTSTSSKDAVESELCKRKEGVDRDALRGQNQAYLVLAMMFALGLGSAGHKPLRDVLLRQQWDHEAVIHPAYDILHGGRMSKDKVVQLMAFCPANRALNLMQEIWQLLSRFGCPSLSHKKRCSTNCQACFNHSKLDLAFQRVLIPLITKV